MAQDDVLRAAFSSAPKNSDFALEERRAKRATRTRAVALSPFRILIKLLFVPVVIVLVTLSIYTEVGPYERTDALRHLLAMAGCDTAMTLGLAPALRGSIGYHSMNDPDGDGIACPLQIVANGPRSAPPAAAPVSATPIPPQTGAKFIRP